MAHAFARRRDKWITERVFPLIESFGGEVVTGHDAFDGITKHVMSLIEASEALIAFTTQRTLRLDGRWDTHAWVIHEMIYATALKRPLLEVREEGVDYPNRILTVDREYVPYKPAARDEVLVRIAAFLGARQRASLREFSLYPTDFVAQVNRVLYDPRLRCTYSVRGIDVTHGHRGELYARGHGIYLRLRDLPPGASIQLHVEGCGMAWSSTFVDPDARSIVLGEKV